VLAWLLLALDAQVTVVGRITTPHRAQAGSCSPGSHRSAPSSCRLGTARWCRGARRATRLLLGRRAAAAPLLCLS